MLTHSVWWVWVPDICQSCNEQRPSHLLPSSPLFLVLLGRWQLVFHGTTKVGWKMTRQSGWGTPWQIAKDLKWKGTNIFGYDPSGASCASTRGVSYTVRALARPKNSSIRFFSKGAAGTWNDRELQSQPPKLLGIYSIYVLTTSWEPSMYLQHVCTGLRLSMILDVWWCIYICIYYIHQKNCPSIWVYPPSGRSDLPRTLLSDLHDIHWTHLDAKPMWLDH